MNVTRMTVDVTELQTGDIIVGAEELGPVRSHRPHYVQPNVEMVFTMTTKEPFGSPQQLEILRPEITVTDSGIDEHGGVWVIARGPASKCDAVRRACAAYSRQRRWGRWISAGASFETGDIVEWRVRYHP